MPAKSKAQQQMFGIAHAIQQGKRPAGSSSSPATDVAKAAKPKDVKAIASTPTKGLPKKVKKEQVEKIREYVTKVVKEVLAEAKPKIRVNDHGKWRDWPLKEGITTKMWKDAGEPFEVWLRYSQASSSQKDQVEKLFAKKYPQITEAYNRGTASININPRNGHIHWTNSQGQYDSDLPVDRGGKRDKGYVKRRVAQIKKQLWGYTITVNDPGGMLKEEAKTWYVNWYDEKKKKWFEKEFKSEKAADKEFEKMRDQQGSISYGTDNSIYG